MRLGVVVSVCLACEAGAAPPTPSEVVAAMRAGVHELRAAEQVFTQCTVQERMQRPGTKTTSGQLLARRSAGGDLLLECGTLIYGRNHQGSFFLERQKLNAEWQLAAFDRDDQSNLFREWLDSRWIAFHPLSAADFQSDVLEFLDQPGFVATATRERGDGLIELDYSHDIVVKKRVERQQIGTLIVSLDTTTS